MPRLIAIEGPESGLALPVQGAETILAIGADRRVKLSRPPEARPPSGVVIRRAISRDGRGTTESEAYAIERYAAPGAAQGPPLFVNGEAIETSAVHHGDLISYAGITLIFDGDDIGRADTALSPQPEEASARGGEIPPRTPPAAGAARPARGSGARAVSPQPDPQAPFDARGGGSIHPPPPPPPPAPSRRTGAFPVPSGLVPHAGRRSSRPAPGSNIPITHDPEEERDALAGDSIMYRRKAYQDAEALLRALEEQERALATGRPYTPTPTPSPTPRGEDPAARAGASDTKRRARTTPPPSSGHRAQDAEWPVVGGRPAAGTARPEGSLQPGGPERASSSRAEASRSS